MAGVLSDQFYGSVGYVATWGSHITYGINWDRVPTLPAIRLPEMRVSRMWVPVAPQETQMEFVAPGFGLAQPSCCMHLGSEQTDERTLTFSPSIILFLSLSTFK